MWKPKGKRARSLTTAAVCSSLAVALAAAAAPLWTGGASGGGNLTAAGTAAAPREGKKHVLVDGAQTPEQIPDRVAYALIFRAVAGRHSEAQKKSIRSYIAQLGLGREACESCPGKRPVNPGEPDSEIEALVEAAEEYHRQVSLLDGEAKAIKDATWQNPTPEAYAALANLQRRKEELTTSVVAGLERRLGPDASARLRQNVEGRVKPLTKIRKKVADR